MKKLYIFFLVLFILGTDSELSAQKILISMDINQNDHLKSYGVAFWTLEHDINVEWLLNYKGGSFLIAYSPDIEKECRIRGVSFTIIDGTETAGIYGLIEENNMERMLLEKAPKIVIYTPPNSQPWDDAVMLALEYAEIPYDKVWDEDVLAGKLSEYDWLHLHHEDFTGQYGRFYASYGTFPWYIEQQMLFEKTAKKLGFSKVSEEKKAIARIIKQYVLKGGFLFAMCSATDTFDIALASEGVDIVDRMHDGDPPDANYQNKLKYSNTFAFTNFKLEKNPLIYEYSDIDIPSSHRPSLHSAEADYFTLFEFSAKYDPVPAMLTQNHVNVVKGFMGQTTAFRRSLLKKPVIILGEVENSEIVKYIHGTAGQGSWAFYGGHDPEDYTHAVGDPPTQLELHKNSPGYRLILNNVLFPAAKKKERKTSP